MKIIHLTDESWDSGLTDYAITLALVQKKAGHSVYFAALKNSFAFKKVSVKGLKVIAISKKISKFVDFAKQINTVNPDILNAHTGSTHTLAAIAKKLSKNKKPFIVRTRADARSLKRKLFSAFIWKNTDGFIAANSKILKQFKENISNEIRSCFIAQGIADIPEISNVGSREQESLGILARLDPVKGHKTAIEALVFVKDDFPCIKLKIAGEEQNTTKAELENYAKKLNVENNVIFEGFVDDKFKFINSCSIGLISSVASEAVSRAAVEWISQGKAVVASDVGGISDIINENCGILTEPANAKKLATDIINLLSDKKRLLALETSAYERFKQNFTAEIFEQKTLKFYKEIIEK